MNHERESEMVPGEFIELDTAEEDARRLRGELAGRFVAAVAAEYLHRLTALRPAPALQEITDDTIAACWALADRLIAADQRDGRAGTAGATTAADEAIQARLALLESRR